MFSGVVGAIVGVLGYLVFDAVVKPFLPINSTILAFGELGVGLWLSHSRKGFLKNLGLAMVFINAFVLAKVYIAPTLQSIIPEIAV